MFGLMFLNFVGVVLFFLMIVMAVKLVFRGAVSNGGGGRGGPWGRRWAAEGCRFAGGDRGRRDAGFDGRGNGHGERWGKHGPGRHERPDQALEHADLRLARGEITTEQYQELRSVLAEPPAGADETHDDDADSYNGGYHNGPGNGRHGDRGNHYRSRGGGRALGIARLRLASGEIGVEEFNTLRTALES